MTKEESRAYSPWPGLTVSSPGLPGGLGRLFPKCRLPGSRLLAPLLIQGLGWVSPWTKVGSVCLLRRPQRIVFCLPPICPGDSRLTSKSFALAVSSGAAWPVSRGTGITQPLVRQEPHPSPAQAWLQKSECLCLALLRPTQWFAFQGIHHLQL